MNRRSYIKLGGALFILLIAIFLYIGSFSRMNEYVRWVNHTHEVMVGYEKVSSDMKSAQMLSSMSSKKKNDSIYELYKNDAKGIDSDFVHLSNLIGDNPRQQRRVKALQINFREYLNHASNNEGSNSMTQFHTNSQFKNLLLIQRLIEDGISDENVLLGKRKGEFRTYLLYTNILSVLFITISLVVIIGTAASTAMESKKREDVERFLESVINTSQHGIITYESIRDESNKIIDFKVIFANNAIAKQLGRSTTDMLGRTLIELSGRDGSHERMDRYIRLVETGGMDSLEINLTVHRKKMWVHVNLAKLNDGFTATSYDITALKNSQQELEDKVMQLEATNIELEQFAYVASHDLQEPLRKIKTFASLINERFNEPSAAFAKVYLKKVIESADRMSHLINDLLNLSDLSKRQDAFIKTNLDNVIKYVLVDFDLIIAEKKAVLETAQLPELEVVPPQMNQLFYNLINNALKFSRRDIQPKVSITSRILSTDEIIQHALNKEKQYYQIAIRDNGIGFKPEFADKIFNIFQRLNNRKLYSGSGIGLALCRKIVKYHHGLIWAESEEGEGACFYIILPSTQVEPVG